MKKQPYILGMRYSHAIKKLREEEIDYRLVRDGDEWYPVTDDFVGERVNIEIRNNKVTKTFLG